MQIKGGRNYPVPRAAPAPSDLRQGAARGLKETMAMWQTIATAPFDRDIELAVIDADGAHALVFPCRRILNGWMNAETRERLDVHPTHWRNWQRTDNRA
jgi:hypothetical protein